jgi:DNA helicase-2/ATP-dependent DNA helicase PcrA
VDKQLNPEQIKAIEHKTGPLLIIAGAGTGKTTVITERIKFLIESKLAEPQEILALTFTEKAAKEMEDRVDQALPYGYTQMWISTFHSFCDRVIRREALHIGLNPNYKLMTEAESVQLIRDNLFKFELNYFRPLGNPNKFIDGMLQHFSRLQDEDVNPDDYLKWANKKGEDQHRELAGIYKAYSVLKAKEGLMDFGDLIIQTLNLFRSRPNILAQYQKQFKYILVDEFQDTNYAQNELVKLLAGKTQNVTVCGDDDQSVYRFRGAAVSNIIQFRKSFPKTAVVVLTKNYRSTQEILDRSYDLIQHNNPDRLEVVEKVDKKLVSQVAKDGDPIEFMHVDRVENEASSVADKIDQLIKENKYEYKDFAILVRANNHSEPFGRALQCKGIPYQFLGPGRLFKQAEIIDLISYLKVLYNFEDSVAFYRLLSIDHFGVSGRHLAELGNYARKNNVSLFVAAEKIGDEKVKVITDLVNKHLELVKKDSAGQILYYFLQDSGLIQTFINPDSPDAEKRANNISKLFDKLKSYEVDHEDARIPAVVDWLELSAELGESPLAADSDWTEVNAVNILTVHSAKGLEFPVVFLVNLVAQRFPSMERHEQIPIPEELIKEILPKGDFHLEEERRLFYVGMTRAKEKLFLTAADYYGEGKREKKLSPFIGEALGDVIEKNLSKDITAQQTSFLDYSLPKSPVSSFQSPVKVNYLSYSQIDTFKVCPLHYKLKYVLKIPTAPSAALSFGTTMHAVMRDFYRKLGEGEKPTEKMLLELLKNNWVGEGFKDKTHEQKYYEKGTKYLTEYLKNSFNKSVTPILTEESFTVPLSSDLKIGGRIDRVDQLSGGRIELIDYKTSEKTPTQKEMDKDKDISRQLAFYALAATTIPTAPFGKKSEDIVLSFYFFENQTKISTVRTTSDLIKAKEEILAIRDEIEKSDFKCSGSFLCKNCEYKFLCNVEN